jgi:putative sterol carrier protein
MADITPKDYFEQTIPENLKANPDVVTKINSIYQFKLSGPNGGDWYVDLTKPGGEVKAGENPGAKCTISMSDNDFVAMVTGKLNSQMAFMTGKLKIKGDMGLALKLQNIMKK